MSRELRADECGHGPLIEAIERWSQAYPLESFPEPDHQATGHDPTLCSASMGRHVIGRLMEYMAEGSDEVQPLDFDAIWDRYYVAAGRNRLPGLTYNELKQVVLGGTDNG